MWTEKILRTELFENVDVTIVMYVFFSARVFLKNKSKMTCDCSQRFQISPASVDGEHLMRFQRETSVVKFLRLSVQFYTDLCCSGDQRSPEKKPLMLREIS